MRQFDKDLHAAALRYTAVFFLSKDAMIEALDITATLFEDLLKAGCAPGAIYAYHPELGWWSALAAYRQTATQQPPHGARCWYSPASLWWLRRAILLKRAGHSLGGVVRMMQDMFETDFVAELQRIPNARLAYLDCFAQDGGVLKDVAAQTAKTEWNAWISGAYGVCLRDFSAHSCIRKEMLVALVKGQSDKIPALELLALSQDYNSLALPFAPWERATSSANAVIDTVLAQLELGRDVGH